MSWKVDSDLSWCLDLKWKLIVQIMNAELFYFIFYKKQTCGQKKTSETLQFNKKKKTKTLNQFELQLKVLYRKLLLYKKKKKSPLLFIKLQQQGKKNNKQ